MQQTQLEKLKSEKFSFRGKVDFIDDTFVNFQNCINNHPLKISKDYQK